MILFAPVLHTRPYKRMTSIFLLHIYRYLSLKLSQILNKIHIHYLGPKILNKISKTMKKRVGRAGALLRRIKQY